MSGSAPQPPAVALRAITRETVNAVMTLAVSPSQMELVADNARSLAQALFTPQAWYRAIYLNDTPVGFVLLYDHALAPDEESEVPAGDLYVWRLMIDARWQGQGVGAAAMRIVIELAGERDDVHRVSLTYTPKDGNAQAFYAGLGFVETGEIKDGEVEMALAV